METTSYIPLADVSKQLPGRPHVSTVFRWSQTGIRGVKLDTIRVGSRLYTTQAAIDRFLDALNKTDAERLTEEGC